MGTLGEVRRLRVRVGVAGCLALTLAAACGTRLDSSAFRGGDATLGGGTAPATATTAPGGTNPASDVGVTATEIRVGLMVSQTSPLGSETFSPPRYGAEAYFDHLNAQGGVNGRTVRLIVCDDGATAIGNQSCAHKLIDSDKVFAFAGNSVFAYASAPYVSGHDVPDVGGEPVGNAYDQYAHLYSIYGSDSPRTGRSVGFDGRLFGGTEVYRWFKANLAARTAGVVYYNQSDSQRYGDLTAAGLQLEGYQVVREQVDFAVPNMDAASIDMRAHHVDIVFDALDANGNVTLCKAMDAAHLQVKAKVVTVQSWDDTVRSQYNGASGCRNSLYATAGDLSYDDVSVPVVSQFRADMRAAFPERESRVSMWEEEGWASAQWFTDAVRACGAQLTRACLEAYLQRPTPYDGHGLLTPRSFTVNPAPGGPQHNCLAVAQWQDGAAAGQGAWVTRTPVGQFSCFDVPSVPYTP